MVGVSVLDVPMWKELHFHDKIQFCTIRMGYPKQAELRRRRGSACVA
jgi:hypothetical protein